MDTLQSDLRSTQSRNPQTKTSTLKSSSLPPRASSIQAKRGGKAIAATKAAASSTRLMMRTIQQRPSTNYISFVHQYQSRQHHNAGPLPEYIGYQAQDKWKKGAVHTSQRRGRSQLSPNPSQPSNLAIKGSMLEKPSSRQSHHQHKLSQLSHNTNNDHFLPEQVGMLNPTLTQSYR